MKFFLSQHNFPAECRHILQQLGEVYRNDAQARDAKLTAEERLRFHQEHSRPVMDTLHAWLEAQFAERMDLSRFLRQLVKTQFSSNGELCHGIVS